MNAQVCLADPRAVQYVALQHSQQIRDLKFNSEHSSAFASGCSTSTSLGADSGAFTNVANESLLLSASMDRTVRLTSLQSNSSVQSYTCTAPVWSLSWSAQNRHQFYAGLQNGSVLLFDTRYTDRCVMELNSTETSDSALCTQSTSSSLTSSRSPVVSLQFLPFDSARNFSYVPCQLNILYY